MDGPLTTTAPHTADLPAPPARAGWVSRVLEKPPRVIAFRAGQELRLLGLRATGGWAQRERSVARRFDDQAVATYLAHRREAPPVVIARDALDALASAPDVDRAELARYGCRLRARQFDLLGAALPATGAWPWHEDWRWGQRWPRAYFRSYDLRTAARSRPFDVKVPWELSRLWWLLPMLQQALLARDPGLAARDAAIVAEWTRENPVAYSVNWCPMEASMRAIALVLMLDVLVVGGAARPTSAGPLVRAIATHGAFVWRTREYTDLPGNHWVANLVALLLAGLALRGFEPEAGRWVDHAAAHVPREIERQFLPDGVSFEKSIAYHRLVAELFLLALLAMERAGWPRPAGAFARLHAACRYSALCTRPDGLTPNVGDNDDARVLAFDPVATRDHRPVVGVAAALFGDGVLKAAAGSMPAALPWLAGARGTAAWQDLTAVEPGSCEFPDGGVAVVRRGRNFLWMDVGEVGLGGRGGHGHNDLLSFELALDGRPVVVDPGCPVYTGDTTRHALFRSTAYHNGLRVDGVEIAPLRGRWRIGADAVPTDVAVRLGNSRGVIRAGHVGYHRLADPVRHLREVDFDAQGGRLTVTDRLECRGSHRSERFLHFAPGIAVELGEGGARASDGTAAWDVRWQAGSVARIEDGLVSSRYGLSEPAEVLVLADDIVGVTTLRLSVTPVGGDHP